MFIVHRALTFATEKGEIHMTLNTVFGAFSTVAVRLRSIGEAIVFGVPKEGELDLERMILRRRARLEREAREHKWERARLLHPSY